MHKLLTHKTAIYNRRTKMKLSTFATLTVFLSGFICISANTVYITSYCGQSLTAYSEIVVKASTYTPYKNCSLYISPRPLDRLAIYISSFNVPCSQGSIQIFNGLSNNPLTGKLCGYSKYDITNKYNVGTNGIKLVYTSNYMSTYRSFTIVTTNYHTGFCEDNEFACSNGRCIDSSLECNGNNNCGDSSDEVCSTIVLGAGIIVAIVFGALFAVVAIPLFIICFVCKRLSYRKF